MKRYLWFLANPALVAGFLSGLDPAYKVRAGLSPFTAAKVVPEDHEEPLIIL